MCAYNCNGVVFIFFNLFSDLHFIASTVCTTQYDVNSEHILLPERSHYWLPMVAKVIPVNVGPGGTGPVSCATCPCHRGCPVPQ